MTKSARPIVTAADIRNAKGALQISRKAIVTPMALDLAAAMGVRIERIDETSAPIHGHVLPQQSPAEIAGRIDHTLLSPTATSDQVRATCEEAVRHQFATVCVLPTHVDFAHRFLGGRVPVCAVVGFPTGAHRPELKRTEADICVAEGAAEIDMVARHDLLKSGEYQIYSNDISSVREVIGASTILKVIIEAPLLTSEEIIAACALAAHAGADFVKTSTGVYAKARAEDIALMRRALPPGVRIKAAGGIRTLADATAMLTAGADRLGTSASVAILTGSATQ